MLWGLQIVDRDIDAIINVKQVGNPELLAPELALYGTFVASAIGQLALSPQTFLNYCLVTSIEQLVEEELLDNACRIENQEKRTSEMKDSFPQQAAT